MTEAGTTLTSVTLPRASSFMSLPFDLRSQETLWVQLPRVAGQTEPRATRSWVVSARLYARHRIEPPTHSEAVRDRGREVEIGVLCRGVQLVQGGLGSRL